jgi:carbonic anhydrase
MQTRWVWAMSVLALVTLPAACAPADAPPVAEETLPSGEVAWGYEAEDGPSVWGRLSATYDLCATGSRQSPIDLPADSVREPVLLAFDYHDSAIELVNDGHTIQLTYDAGSGIDLNGRRFTLRQLHFHAPGEHTRAGRAFPAEIHFAHESAAGGLAVVGALVEVGRRNAALASVLDNLPQTVGLPRGVLEERVSAAAILGSAHASILYEGSLTTPPCTEGVRWIVLAAPISIDEAQLERLHEVLRENSRPVQPANGRSIVSDAP